MQAPDCTEDDGIPLRNFLVRYAKGRPSRPILFPTRDLDVTFIDNHRELLDQYFAIAQARHEILDSVINKARLTATAAAFGLTTPRTVHVDASAGSYLHLPDELNYPVIIKAVYAHEPHAKNISVGTTQAKAHIAETPTDALAQAHHLVSQGVSVFIQEFIAGPTDHLVICAGYLSANDKDSRTFTARKRLQYPEDAGIGRIVETIDYPNLAKRTLALLRHVGYLGIFEAEFKEDAQGAPYLIEINTRHWDQHRLGSACGVDVSTLAINDLLGVDLALPTHQYRHAIWYDDPFTARLAMGRDANWRQLKKQLTQNAPSAKRINSIFTMSDPLPAIRIYFDMTIDILLGLQEQITPRIAIRRQARKA